MDLASMEGDLLATEDARTGVDIPASRSSRCFPFLRNSRERFSLILMFLDIPRNEVALDWKSKEMGGGDVSDWEGKRNDDEDDKLVLASAGTTICITRGSSNRCCENARDRPEPVGACRSSMYEEDDGNDGGVPGL